MGARVSSKGQGVNPGTEVTWRPTAISGLKIWLDCWQEQYGEGKHYADNDAVGQLTDFSGNSNHAIQATSAAKPTFKVSVTATRPVARFDGVDDYLATAAFSSLAQPNTVFTVHKNTSGNLAYIYDGITETDRHALAHSAGVDGFIYAGNVVNTSTLDTGFLISSAIFNGLSSSLRKNGVSHITGNAGAQALTGVTLGARLTFTTLLEGDIAEVLLYSGALSDANHNLVGQYLARKYGLSWTAI